MFVTDFDLQSHSGFRRKLCDHFARINANARSHLAPKFVIEKASLVVRLRKPKFGARSDLGGHEFVGGESFRLDNIVVVERSHAAGLEVSATFCPTKPSMAAQIVSVTLPLSGALEVFPELWAWCEMDTVLEGTGYALDRAHEHAALDLLPTVAEVQSSALWGVW